MEALAPLPAGGALEVVAPVHVVPRFDSFKRGFHLLFLAAAEPAHLAENFPSILTDSVNINLV